MNKKVKAISNYAVTGTERSWRIAQYWQCLLKISAICSTALCLQSSGSSEGENTDAPRLLHRRAWRSAVSLGRRSETSGNSPSYVGSVWTEHRESTKGLWVGPLKKALCGRRFTSNEEVKEAVHAWFWEQPKSFFCAGIQKLVERYNKYIVLQGDCARKIICKIAYSYFYYSR